MTTTVKEKIRETPEQTEPTVRALSKSGSSEEICNQQHAMMVGGPCACGPASQCIGCMGATVITKVLQRVSDGCMFAGIRDSKQGIP